MKSPYKTVIEALRRFVGPGWSVTPENTIELDALDVSVLLGEITRLEEFEKKYHEAMDRMIERGRI
jgi:hypothetical protein